MAGKSKTTKLFTLTEVSKRTGISMPTLQRYKKTFADRIPSEGSGRTQRYPQSALEVFKTLKEENLKRRGRPKKSTSAASAPKKPARKVTRSRRPAKKATAPKPAAKKASRAKLLTLTEIGKRTGISYPTLLRYVRAHLNRIPHEGEGRARRFPVAAVAMFKEIREESGKRRGGRKAAKATPKAAPKKAAKAKRTTTASSGGDTKTAARLQALEKAHRSLVKEITKLQKAVSRPIQVKVSR